MSATTDRVVCPRCGANNFATQAACWKCGASLATGGAPLTSPAPANSNYAASRPGAPLGTGSDHAPIGAVNPAYTTPITPPVRPADPSVAFWSALLLGLLFPYVAVPAGMVFLMLDDRRRVEVGRLAIIWGIVGTILNLLLSAWLLGGVISTARSMIPSLGRSLPGQSSGASPTNPNESVPIPHFPGPND